MTSRKSERRRGPGTSAGDGSRTRVAEQEAGGDPAEPPDTTAATASASGTSTPPATAAELGPRRHVVWGSVDLALAIGLGATIWGVLPARWLPVDLGGSLFAAALGVAGVGLLLGTRWGRIAGLVASGLTLLAGLALTTGLALTASYLSGIYGPVGKGGAIILAFVAVIVLPYFVVLPAAQLVALRPTSRSASA